MKNNNITLDQEQLAAATSPYENTLIIAGAGTGKTTTLIKRIEYLRKEKDIQLNEILVLSFTNETVHSFQKKYFDFFHEEVEVKTFHKLALEILKKSDAEFYILEDSFLPYLLEELPFCYPYLSIKKRLFSILKPTFFYTEKKFLEMIDSKDYKDLKKIMISFLHLYQANNFKKADFVTFLKKGKKKEKSFLIFIYYLLQIYENEKKSQGWMDFDDLINEAKEAILLNKVILPFKAILIDEFQDCSFLRFSFIEAIIKQTHASLTMVGDDYQSIYQFSGCDLSLFLSIDHYFKELHIFKIQHTYRFSQELGDMLSFFIMKNPQQIEKKMVSTIFLKHPIEVIFYKHPHQGMKKLLNYLENQSCYQLLFLGRNHFDLSFYFNESELIWLKDGYFELIHFPNFCCRFLTVHKSKGLEHENVVVLHLEDSTYGFPNKVKNAELLRFVLKKELFFLEEERRLFYVALSRTKQKVFLFTSFQHPSCFVLELMKSFKRKIKVLFF